MKNKHWGFESDLITNVVSMAPMHWPSLARQAATILALYHFGPESEEAAKVIDALEEAAKSIGADCADQLAKKLASQIKDGDPEVLGAIRFALSTLVLDEGDSFTAVLSKTTGLSEEELNRMSHQRNILQTFAYVEKYVASSRENRWLWAPLMSLGNNSDTDSIKQAVRNTLEIRDTLHDKTNKLVSVMKKAGWSAFEYEPDVVPLFRYWLFSKVDNGERMSLGIEMAMSRIFDQGPLFVKFDWLSAPAESDVAAITKFLGTHLATPSITQCDMMLDEADELLPWVCDNLFSDWQPKEAPFPFIANGNRLITKAAAADEAKHAYRCKEMEEAIRKAFENEES